MPIPTLHWFIPFAILFVVALVSSLITVPLASRLAWRVGAIDRPSKRRINTVPIPRMGGVAVFIGIGVAAVMYKFGTECLGWTRVFKPLPEMQIDYWLVASGAAMVFATGVVDDVKSLRPVQKLIGQILSAILAVSGGLVIGNIVNPFGGGEISLGWLSYPITVIYMVAFMNIINLIDGLDGLAGGITVISCLTMFGLSVISGRLDAAMAAIVTAGAVLGFLKYNFHPAKIFLGDSGSLLLGFMLAAISLMNVTRVAGLTTMLIPLVIALVPITDTLAAIVRREREHVSIMSPDKGHIHHRLLQDGFDQKTAVMFIYLWTMLLCLGAVIMTQVGVYKRIAVFLVLFVASFIVANKLNLFTPVLKHRDKSKDDEHDDRKHEKYHSNEKHIDNDKVNETQNE